MGKNRKSGAGARSQELAEVLRDIGGAQPGAEGVFVVAFVNGGGAVAHWRAKGVRFDELAIDVVRLLGATLETECPVERVSKKSQHARK